MDDCKKNMGSYWVADDIRMDVICGKSIVRSNRQYCNDCIVKIPGCHIHIGAKFCGIPHGLEAIVEFCTDCKKSHDDSNDD